MSLWHRLIGLYLASRRKARCLIFGCGSGWAAGRFRDLGFEVDAIDGSEGLAAEAQARYGIKVSVASFDSLAAIDRYHGIWASFCLLHDSREAMPAHLCRLHRALHPGGLLYLGLKEGTGCRRDALDRFYTYFEQAEISGLLTKAGFNEPEIDCYSAPGMEGQDEPCMDIFVRRG